ncbi:MAG TPA: hypothetical protein ENO05_04275 [Bacteroides sp.]|nr:hypothetical protein [Bacteroides sp.]
MRTNRPLFLPAAVLLLLIAQGCGTGSGEPEDFPADWPVLKHYDAGHVDRIALPLGGIGTGTVSLGGRGNLRDWEIMNRPAKGYNPGPRFDVAPFFVLYTESGDEKDTRLLEGPVPEYAYEGSRGVNTVPNHGMPRFEKSTFDAAYPFGQVNLFRAGLPVKVRIRGFNPLVPADVDKSSIPLAALTIGLMNTSDREVDASVCFSMQNFIGEDGFSGTSLQNRNEFREEEGIAGIFMYSEGVDPAAEQWGTMAVTTRNGSQVTCRTSWRKADWGAHLLDFWDDFSADGMLEERSPTGEDKPMASLASKVRLQPGELIEIPFFITWHFPNRKAWSYSMLKNYYTTQYRDAWDAAVRTWPELEKLEEETAGFVNAFTGSDLPGVVKEAALFNISTLRTQTCFRTSDGYFFSWEGYHDHAGSSWGSCTHVYNYEHATGFLFGELARLKREIEFGRATDSGGLMSFRVRLPLDSIPNFKRAAADGQTGAIMKMYRDWQLSGDDQLLRKLYPAVKRAMRFCWIGGGWDADMDGVMEGAQHNTMDVEYFGPNPQMGLWYLGALRAVEEMAAYLGDMEFSALCGQLFVRGSRWLDEHLFNGEYYIHRVEPPERAADIHPGLVVGMGSDNLLDPEYQLGEGCLVDQLVGQYVAHVCGLGYLVNRGNIVTTLQSILKYNHRESLEDHFNCLRTYALGNESALLMAAYPGERPVNPFPYFTEVMTGFEYAAAVGMLYEGMEEEGLQCIRDIRDRYDGFKRNPFDEAEWGHHYGRAMASWSAVLALTGFRYSAVEGSMAFRPKKGNHFWSNGYRYGTVEIRDEGTHMQVTLRPVNGELTLNRFVLKGYGEAIFGEGKVFVPGLPAAFRVEKE